MTAGYRRTISGLRPDWHAASLGDSRPCVHCGRGAILRHPITGRPCHKDCGDADMAAEQAASEQHFSGRATANRSELGA